MVAILEEGRLIVALFTSKADAGLPLCTSFYQLDFSGEVFEGSELDLWLASWLKRKYPMPYKSFSEMAGKGQKKADPELYLRFRAFHGAFCHLLETFADGKKLSGEETATVNAMLKEYLPPPVLSWDKERNCYGIEFHSNPEPRSHMLMELFETLEREKTENIKLFTRCEECKNPFLIQKEGQRFCSQRCRTRVTSRRRYANLFSDHGTRRSPSTGQNTVQSR